MVADSYHNLLDGLGVYSILEGTMMDTTLSLKTKVWKILILS